MTWILHYHKYLLHKTNGKCKFSSYLYGDKNRKKIYEKKVIDYVFTCFCIARVR